METKNTQPERSSADEPIRTAEDEAVAGAPDTAAPEDLSTALDALGETDEDRLDVVAERNDSLEERLPAAKDSRHGADEATSAPPGSRPN
jgi:hypothetical protein